MQPPFKHFIFSLALICSTAASLPKPPGIVKPVPAGTSRFDVPWRLPPRPHMPTLAESGNRVLYSGVKEAVSDGLGHGMATINADVGTALRLNLTYTHRVAKYGSLVSSCFLDELQLVQGGRMRGGCGRNGSGRGGRGNVAGLSEEAGRVEGFFGWGVGEIPREAVQDVACKVRDGEGDDVSKCKLCRNEDLKEVKKGREGGNSRLKVDRIVEIPMEFSYMWPHKASDGLKRRLKRFLERNNKENTVFHMPHEVCGKSPAYSKFFPEARGFFFHKYWEAHGGGEWGKKRRVVSVEGGVRLYRESWMHTLRIPGVPRRGRLERLKESELTIGIHARRGDFFSVGRPMVSTRVFAKVVRRVVYEIGRMNGTFGEMDVRVSFYSEGRPKEGLGEGVGHDVKRLTRAYMDDDGREMTVDEVKQVLERDEDGLGKVFGKRALNVELRVSEDTLVCLHEMVASDVFIGSRSGMSQHLVGSLARGIVLLPSRIDDASQWWGHVAFDDTGIQGQELDYFKAYWKEFEHGNTASARRAWLTLTRSKNL